MFLRPSVYKNYVFLQLKHVKLQSSLAGLKTSPTASHHLGNSLTQCSYEGDKLTNKRDLLMCSFESVGKINNSNSQGKIELLEQELSKVDAFNKEFNDHTYQFTHLPPNFADNQFIPIEKSLEDNLQNILKAFSRSPIQYAFAYGSGVFDQKGYSKGEDPPQIDMIFGVTDPIQWHSSNMQANPSHYSFLKYFGSEVIASIQEIGAGIYFNPYVNINGQDVKYGVVSMDRLLKDLATWDSFYLAGRLQKPVKILKNDLRVQYWNQLNLKAAATLSKHLTFSGDQDRFDEFKFYETLTGLSYLGDIRYKVGGENPKKIHNIVAKNLDNFRYYYNPILKDVFDNNITHLPKGYTLEDALPKLEKTISATSIQQTLKGIFTAGMVKSVKYAWSKKLKAMQKH